ncbi:Uncharacterized protein TCM_009672 [Theobroma cacao]|uniref:Retrotransposon Copia-like N-terminal domain-containing protein n=1 Tax=Theobroma cacao TaxID=3641 RepID=A0A061E544_THECC|nr:Uncharacterized protein TCM_009672 [Theobroma cacao]
MINRWIRALPSNIHQTSAANPLELASNVDYQDYTQKDQFLLHAIIASTTESIVSLFASYNTSFEAWQKMNHLFANKSRSHMMNLREKLSQPTSNKSITRYFQL